MTPATGLHRGVPFGVYREWDSTNHSKISGMAETPMHCRWNIDHDEADTASLALGRATHMAVFEPSAYAKEVVIAPDVDRRTKAGKEDWAAFVAASVGKTVIDREDAEKIAAMCANIRKHPAAAMLIDAPGECELSMVWKDEETGLLCKGRIDKLITLDGRPTVIELKTARSASRRGFGGAINEYGYHAQAAMYAAGYAACTGQTPDHVFVAVENEGPHAVACYTLNDQSAQTGQILFREWIKRYAECLRTGIWPGYSEDIEVIDIPHWALADEVTR